MDHHKMLYKEQRSFTANHRSRINREWMEARRIQNRRDGYQEFRKISPSPIRIKKELIISKNCSENKENITNITTGEKTNTTRLAKIICTATNPEKLTKQESFLRRFLEWNEKKRMKKEETNKKKPFISAVSSKTQTSTYNFVPSGHHKGFRPPEGLEKTVDQKNEKPKPAVEKGRLSIYSVVPTPPRPVRKCANKFPMDRKTVATSSTQPATANKSKTKTSVVYKQPISVKKSPTKSKAQGDEDKLVSTLENKTTKTANFAQPPLLKNNLRPQASALKMSVKPTTAEAAATSTNRQTGAVAKVRSVTQKKAGTSKQNKNSPIKKSGAGLAQNLKAKKANNTKKLNAPTLKINGKTLKNLINSNLDEDMVIQTPKDFFVLNPFKELVTSTRIKSSTDNSKNAEEISPVETSREKLHSNSSSKRNIFQETNNTLCKQSDYKPQENTKEDGLKNFSKKFNFIRYSNVADVTDIDQKDNGKEKQGGEEEINNWSGDGNKTVHVLEANKTTPVKSSPEKRPINYLSPYVSVARGKVNLKTEEQKRNSVYLPLLAAESIDVPSSPKHSIEVRRTIEGVRYFRKQLQDEIDRLHKLCDIWETYKTENLETIQNANGEDMINVTIGQTRLLTNKKFMQFKGLIDRCEAGATGIGKVECDGSENTKPITLIDLEGFWSMLGLQIDNLDKRFDNLNRWKLNDWKDPDEVEIKIKKNLTGVKKNKPTVSKAKPSLALQSMLRKMKAEMRKNKNDVNNEEVQIQLEQTRQSSNSNKATPRKSIDTSMTRHLYTVVKDRKYFSPAATVISVSYRNSRPSRNQRKSLQESPK